MPIYHDIEPIEDIGELYKIIELKKEKIDLDIDSSPERKYFTGWFDALQWVQNKIDGILEEG